jgi:hypothetical protein
MQTYGFKDDHAEHDPAQRPITLVGGVVFDVMIGQPQKAIRRPGVIGLQLGSAITVDANIRF